MAQLFVIPSKKKASGSEKQNIKVVVRARPLSRQEEEANVRTILKYLSQKDILAKDKRFQFDKVFKPDVNQIEVYQHVVAPMIPDILSGYNCTVFAYGQTGSGKTYTMTGHKCECIGSWKEDLEVGIIPRAATHVFDLLPTNRPDKSVKVSYLELYNEEIRDLLSDDDTPLNVYNDMKGSIFIQGLTEVNIRTSGDICKQLSKGNIKRQTAPTLMNHQSSRSHTVFTITVFTKDSTLTNEDILKTGKINFVDLAGSENIARSGCKDMRAVELANINKSLLTLGRVIHALADKTKKHVPYRDSKLTRILQDSLGGHTKTCIIATISPASNSLEETVSTLEYACRARDIKNSPTVNEKLSHNQIIDSLFSTIKKLEGDLEASRGSEGFYVNKDNYNALMEELETLKADKVLAKNILKEKEKQIEVLEDQVQNKNKEFDESVESSRQVLDKLKQDVKQKRITLRQERFVSRTYEQQATHLHKEAQELLKTSELLSDHTNILQRKLENQYYINKSNENHVRDAVSKVLDMLRELSEETISMRYMDGNICQLSQKDISEFKVALEGSVNMLKAVLDNFDRSLIHDLPIKENIIGVLKDYVHIIGKQIADIKTKFGDFSVAHHQFAHDYISEFPMDIKQVITRFQNAVYNTVKKINELLKTDDIKIFNTVEHLESEILTKKREEEIMHKKRMEKDAAILNKISSLKDLIVNRHKNRGERLVSELMELTTQSRNEMDVVLDNFIDAYKGLNANVPSYENLDTILEETDKFGKTLETETIKLEQMHVTDTNRALDSLNKTLTGHYEEIATSVNSDYETLNCRFQFLIDDKKQERTLFKSFVEKTSDILAKDFLEGVVVTTHEGNTPARQPELRRKALDSLTSREVLLQKFNALPLAIEDEDKENHHSVLNMSTSSFESFRPSTSEFDLGDAQDDSNVKK